MVRILTNETDEIADAWRDLCKWDPMLPPDNRPPIASVMIKAIADDLTLRQSVNLERVKMKTSTK